MHTTTVSATAANTSLASILLVAFMGVGLFFAAGLASAATLHDSAHDVRHASGFPCH